MDDPCEILVTGFPSQLKRSPNAIVNRLLAFVSLTSAINHVFDIRSWKPKSYRGTSRSFVVKFSSPIIRDEVISKLYRFKNFDSKLIFGSYESSKISVSNLLAKPTYLLLLSAKKKSILLAFRRL